MASDRNLDLALRIKAEANSARAELKATEDELKRVGSAARDAGGGAKSYGDQLDKTTVAQRNASRGAKATADAAARESKSWQQVVAAQNAAMNRYTAAQKPMRELDALLSKRTLTNAEVARAEAILDRAQARGAISSAELSAAFAKLDAAKIKDIAITEVQSDVTRKAALNSRATAEIATAASEVLSGNLGRLRRTGAAFANQSGLLRKLMTPTGLAITGVAGAVALLSVQFIKGQLDAQHYGEALIATNNYAARTSAQLATLARDLGSSRKEFAGAREAVVALASSGRISGDALDQAATAALDFARVTGSSVEEAVKTIISLRDDPVDAVYKLDQQYHFLTASVYDHIVALQREGDEEQAVMLAQSALADAMDDRRQRDERNLGTLQRAWRDLRNEIARGIDVIRSWGAENEKAQLDALYVRRSQAQDRVDNPFGKLLGYHDDAVAAVADIDKQIAAIKERQEAEAHAAAAENDRRKDQAAGVKALHDIAQMEEQAATAADQYARRIKRINEDFDAAIKAMPKQAAELNARRTTLLRATVEDYISSLNRAAGKNTDKKAQREAAALAKAAADAASQLRDSFIQLQAAQDPVAAAWARYNDTVEKATRAAETAKRATNANTQAIDGQLKAIRILAASTRDAALDKIAERDRQAWERLRDSLRTPAEVSLEKAVDQLQELERLFKKGVVDAEEYHRALQRIGQQSVTNAPQYRGLDAAVGGMGGELAKNYEAQAALDDWHQQQLAANEAFRAEDAANEEAYQARLATIEEKYAQQRNKIEQARGRLQLRAAADVFGQLATLSQSQNAKMARIGKAAAIAQAVISTYQSANDAYAAMASIPYVGPALGAAAAAAAIAAGLANVAQIRAQPVGAYATGGPIHGPGTGTSDSILIAASDGEFMHRSAAVDYYGLDFMRRVNNLEFPRFARGGLINGPGDFAGVAGPQITSSPMPRMRAPGAASGAAGAAPQLHVKNVVVFDREELAEQLMNTEAGHKVIVTTVGENPRAIQGRWGAG